MTSGKIRPELPVKELTPSPSIQRTTCAGPKASIMAARRPSGEV